MTDIDSRYRAGRKSASSGDSALTPEPRPESFILDDLPLPVPGGYGSNATGRCKEVRGEKFLGKQVRGDKGEEGIPLPVPRGCGKKANGRRRKKVRDNVSGKQVRREKVEKKEEPCLRVVHWNAEGVFNKADALKMFLFENKVDVCCVQETHLQEGKTFKIRGYQVFRNDRQGHKGGVLTLVRNNIQANEIRKFTGEAEYLHLRVTAGKLNLDIVNYYCPDNKMLSLETIDVPTSNFIIAGDFNSHSQSWGYFTMNRRGEEVETWQDENKLILMNQSWDIPTFYSRVWHSSTTPDLAFCTEDIHQKLTREVCGQLAGSDHRPVMLSLQKRYQVNQAQHPRWNYKKAQWELFAIRANENTKDIKVERENPNKVYKEWAEGILKAAKETIPRGVRKGYEPHWNKDLQKAHDTLNNAREEAENDPGERNHIKLQRCKAEYHRKNLESKRKGWREKTASLDMERDTTKLWKLVGALNGEGGGYEPISLEQDGEILSEKKAANVFAKAYEKVCDVDVPVDRRNAVRIEEEDRLLNQKDIPDIMIKNLSMAELQKAIRKLKKKKSPGPDGITNELIMHLRGESLQKMLDIFNLTWKNGDVPQQWKEATMIPILKQGKNKSKPLSYRPISLTSCVCKTMERIIGERMKWYLESEAILAPEQAGFRQYRSTEDQTTHLAQVIEDAFQAKKVVLASFIDLQKAFDKVWKEGVGVKMLRAGIRGNMLRWTRSYLHNRKARVLVNGVTGRKVLLRQGVPQGGVLSPTLFILFINDVVKELPKGVKAALYADDLVLWCTEEQAATATYRMQLALNNLSEWTEKWCLKINKDKSAVTLFTLSTQKAGKLTLGNEPLQYENEQTYLGVTFDKRLTWKAQIEKAESRARRRLGMMRKLAGTSWGANERTLKQVYQGNVRPILEYGSGAYMSAAKSHLNSLEKVQNQALRVITGAMRSTPIDKMQKITGIAPLGQRRDSKVLIMFNKAKAMKDHPMHERTEQRGQGRLKRTSFVREAKTLQENFKEELPGKIEPIGVEKDWREASRNFNVQTQVPGLNFKEEASKEVQRSLSLEMMEERYPKEIWTHAFTDGSASKAVRDGGAGVFIKYPGGISKTLSAATGVHCTNYKAEVEALIVAAGTVGEDTDPDGQIVFLTDALSVLQELEKSGIPRLENALGRIECARISLQWIPAHCGIPGNEEADRQAKLGAEKEQPETKASFREVKTIIKSLHRPTKLTDGYQGLSRAEQVCIFRLRTGHNRLNHHMHTRFRIGESPRCPCGAAAQTAEHILQYCPTYSDLRKRLWPTGNQFEDKVYGTAVALRTTFKFIEETGLSM